MLRFIIFTLVRGQRARHQFLYIVCWGLSQNCSGANLKSELFLYIVCWGLSFLPQSALPNVPSFCTLYVEVYLVITTISSLSLSSFCTLYVEVYPGVQPQKWQALKRFCTLYVEVYLLYLPFRIRFLTGFCTLYVEVYRRCRLYA